MLAPQNYTCPLWELSAKETDKTLYFFPAHSGVIVMLPRPGDGSGVENLPSVRKDLGYIHNTQNQKKKIIKT